MTRLPLTITGTDVPYWIDVGFVDHYEGLITVAALSSDPEPRQPVLWIDVCTVHGPQIITVACWIMVPGKCDRHEIQSVDVRTGTPEPYQVNCHVARCTRSILVRRYGTLTRTAGRIIFTRHKEGSDHAHT